MRPRSSAGRARGARRESGTPPLSTAPPECRVSDSSTSCMTEWLWRCGGLSGSICTHRSCTIVIVSVGTMRRRICESAGREILSCRAVPRGMCVGRAICVRLCGSRGPLDRKSCARIAPNPRVGWRLRTALAAAGPSPGEFGGKMAEFFGIEAQSWRNPAFGVPLWGATRLVSAIGDCADPLNLRGRHFQSTLLTPRDFGQRKKKFANPKTREVPPRLVDLRRE